MEGKSLLTEMKLYEEMAEKRLSVYQFLGATYTQILDREVLTKLLLTVTPDFVAYKPTATDEINELIIDGFNFIKEFVTESIGKDLDLILQELAVEYTRLLRGVKVGYGPKPPYESVYHKSSNCSEQNLLTEINHYYRYLGVSYQIKERPDYIGIELDLMRYLVEQERKGWQEVQQDEALKYLKEQKYFFEEHLISWVPEFCEIMFQKSRHNYYKGISLITSGYISDDGKYLQKILQENNLFSEE